MSKERLSVSVPVSLVIWTRQFALDEGVSISYVVTESLRRLRAGELRREIITGSLEDRYGTLPDAIDVERLAQQVEQTLTRKSTVR